jgi:linoleate 9S-lipoxygenase
VPRDERFSQVKFSDFIGYAAKSLIQVLVAGATSVFDKTPTEFDKFEDVHKLYNDGVGLPEGVSLTKLRKCVPWDLFQEITRSDGDTLYNFPLPDVIKGMMEQ